MTCPSCGERASTRVVAGLRDRFGLFDHPFQIRRCGGCGIRFTWPMSPEIARRAYPDRYEGHVVDSDPTIPDVAPGATEGWARFLKRMLGRTLSHALAAPLHGYGRREQRALVEDAGIPRGGRLLEIGCGAGVRLERWKAGRPLEVGLDVSAAALREARRRLGGPFVRADAASLPFQSGAFESVLLCHSLEHVIRFGAALDEICRIVRPGGRILIWMPNFGSWYRRWFQSAWVAYEVPRHTVHLTADDAVRLFHARGARVETVRYNTNWWQHFMTSRQVARRRPLLGWVLWRRPVALALQLLAFLNRRGDDLFLRVRRPDR